MPPGIQRLNAKRSQPNDRIVFIKPLKGADEQIAQDFLERIAAQCLPIMREHHLSVMSLEEYEPNSEFVGRNFNAGEVIQLVLKARSGHWLPFNYVQMVMMHELAHCKQMNHSRAFWAVRNQYADGLRELWTRGFTGEGLWGRGALLSTGQFEKNMIKPGELLPEHLCGGTYRSRGRKRKAKKVLSYKEQKERRILKKFGANGVALGEDSDIKRKLEGISVTAKPRVAGSVRGRELRAAAALARFEQQKEEPKEEEKEDVDEGSETDSGDDYEDDTTSGPDALDLDGRKLLDSKGRGMVKVCEDEDPGDQGVQDELRELQSFRLDKPLSTSTAAPEKKPENSILKSAPVKRESAVDQHLKEPKPLTPKGKTPPDSSLSELVACPACTFLNGPGSATCTMCSSSLAQSTTWGSKTCPNCTFVNEPGSTTCDICGSDLP